MESIGNLAGGIAHDFNNILASILGFTELALNAAEPGSEIEADLQEVITGGKRAKELVKQILAFARQSDEITKPISINDIASEVLNLLRSTIPASIEITTNFTSPSFVMANGIQLHQIFLNIFSNAAYAMKEHGGDLKIDIHDVKIDLAQQWDRVQLTPGDYVEIQISDTGTGITPEAIEYVFEPYFTTKGPGEGSGMGLAVACGIIEKYGGRIIAESILGKETVFTFYLPITSRTGLKEKYLKQELPKGDECILVVDDEPPLAKMTARSLERLGYTVVTRTSSTEALELFRSRPNDFDLVLTDMTMPHLSGDKLAIALMEIRKDIPIILCTGYSATISEETALQLGIRAYTYKPLAHEELAKTIRKVLDE